MVQVLIAMLTLATPSTASGVPAGPAPPAARCEALAERLHVAASLRPIVGALCRTAPTFRRQVVRLASERGLDITVDAGTFGPGTRVRARTAMTRVAGRLRRAVVEVPSGDPSLVAELMAHEFEHIVEQLDRVDLAAWSGRSGVYRVGGPGAEGPFETERARQVGRLVAGEFMAAEASLTARRAW